MNIADVYLKEVLQHLQKKESPIKNYRTSSLTNQNFKL